MPGTKAPEIGRPVREGHPDPAIPGRTKIYPLHPDGTRTGVMYHTRDVIIITNRRTGAQRAMPGDGMAGALAAMSLGKDEEMGQAFVEEGEAQALWDGKARIDTKTQRVTMLPEEV